MTHHHLMKTLLMTPTNSHLYNIRLLVLLTFHHSNHLHMNPYSVMYIHTPHKGRTRQFYNHPNYSRNWEETRKTFRLPGLLDCLVKFPMIFHSPKIEYLRLYILRGAHPIHVIIEI